MIALDVLVGVSYLLAALLLRRVRQFALLAAATGVLWFAGDLVQPLVFAHRAPHSLLLLYPGTRFRWRGQRWLIEPVRGLSDLSDRSAWCDNVMIFVASSSRSWSATRPLR
jgi:hypothetical protein